MPTSSGGDERSAWTRSARAGEPVDLAPWTFEWRADRRIQRQPEAYFIPRRLDRLDRIYRTAHDALPTEQLKSIYYDMPDLLKRFPPPPSGRLQVGLLWTGALSDYRVELHWPAGAAIPSPERVEVRDYPTSFGWFGWTVDRALVGPTLSPDRRIWTYHSLAGELMDSSYSTHVPAATEMVAVFCEPDGTGAAPVVPELRLLSPKLGNWQQIDLEVEWGFDTAARQRDFDGRLEPYMATVGAITALQEDTGTTITGQGRWRSRASGGPRRGIIVRLLYAPDSRPGLDSRLTLRFGSLGVTFRIKDLDKGPILIGRQGVFIAKAGGGQTARGFAQHLADRRLESVRQMTREHAEAASLDDVLREVRLWRCPAGTPLPRFPQVANPPMEVQLSDDRWTDAWRAASNQLTQPHMWGGLAFEVARVARAMDLIGLHDYSDKVYKHFLDAPGAKSDGDYADGHGALELAASMRHDMGYSHDGTHASTGRLLFAMAGRCLLTGDKAWFLQRLPRLQAAADWIIRQRSLYMKDVPNRNRLAVAGLMPPCMLGDYALPTCDWHWYYVDNALAVQGLQQFANALDQFEPGAAAKYLREADSFRKALRRAVDRDTALSPVRLGRDGLYHSYIPRMVYARGLTGPELGAPQFPETDLWMGALPLAEPLAAVDADDPRMIDTLDRMEEMGTSMSAVQAEADARKQKGLPTEDAWFWHSYSILPKASHTADIYLLQDDVQSFLRFWINSYASMVGSDGKLWEHSQVGNFDPCTAPDNGTAGWFMENFRNLLVMEEGQSLWLARATPRGWLAQGKKIAVTNAPTNFGTLTYEIVSDVDHGRIGANLYLPDRRPAGSVILRLRHPSAAPMKSVTVNGRPWSRFNSTTETIRLVGLEGKTEVVATY